jgi:hypothetical protein
MGTFALWYSGVRLSTIVRRVTTSWVRLSSLGEFLFSGYQTVINPTAVPLSGELLALVVHNWKARAIEYGSLVGEVVVIG